MPVLQSVRRTRQVLTSFCIWFAVFAGTANGASRIAAADAELFVSGLGQQAIEVLRRPDNSLERREAEFRSILATKFDLPFISRFVLGKYWRQADQEQKDEYQELFSDFVLRTYSARLGGYAGQLFLVESAVAGGERDMIVRSVISGGSGPQLRADWRVRLIDEAPRIIDVSVEGISMAITQREEFAAVIARQGIDGLLQLLRARANRLPAEGLQ